MTQISRSENNFILTDEVPSVYKHQHWLTFGGSCTDIPTLQFKPVQVVALSFIRRVKANAGNVTIITRH